MIKHIIIAIPVSPHGELAWQITPFLIEAERECAKRGVKVDHHIHTGKPNTSTRNLQMTHFLKTKADAIVFCDSDAVPDVPSLLLMLDGAERDDVDILGGWSLMVAGGDTLVPNIVGQANAAGEGKVMHHIPQAAPGLYEITGGSIGSHCLLVKRHVVGAFHERSIRWFEDKFYESADMDGDDFGTRSRGHDLLFCHRAAEMGFRLWVDNRVFWGHAKTTDMRAWWYRVHGLCQQLNAQKACVDALRETWGNTEWTASSEFLMRMAAEASVCDGLIVECGSGVSSKVLEQMECEVISIESNFISTGSGRACMSAPLLAAPLVPYTTSIAAGVVGFDWYDPDVVNEAIAGRTIAMLIVDGPAGTTRGGRRGCLTLRDRMAPGATVMFDDVHRAAEKALVDEWCEPLGDIEIGETTCSDGRKFAVLKMPGG